MGSQKVMRRFAKWHIWLGWLAGLPILMWTVTGLVMTIKPIEEVRGNHLRIEREAAVLPAGNPFPIAFPVDDSARYTEMRVVRQGDRAVWLLTRDDDTVERYPADRAGPLDPIDEAYARSLVARDVVGGADPVQVRFFPADQAPFDLRRAIPAWQVALRDGSHVYVHGQTGEIAAVRTRFWRLFDTMWGLHIMDLSDREDTSHPILIAFAALSVIAALLGCILMFRRRRYAAPARAR